MFLMASNQPKFDVIGALGASKQRKISRSMNQLVKNTFEKDSTARDLTTAELAAKIFDDIDTNKDGTLQKSELLAAGIDIAALSALDLNKDGKVDREEFMASMCLETASRQNLLAVNDSPLIAKSNDTVENTHKITTKTVAKPNTPPQPSRLNGTQAISENASPSISVSEMNNKPRSNAVTSSSPEETKSKSTWIRSWRKGPGNIDTTDKMEKPIETSKKAKAQPSNKRGRKREAASRAISEARNFFKQKIRFRTTSKNGGVKRDPVLRAGAESEVYISKLKTESKPLAIESDSEQEPATRPAPNASNFKPKIESEPTTIADKAAKKKAALEPAEAAKKDAKKKLAADLASAARNAQPNNDQVADDVNDAIGELQPLERQGRFDLVVGGEHMSQFAKLENLFGFRTETRWIRAVHRD